MEPGTAVTGILKGASLTMRVWEVWPTVQQHWKRLSHQYRHGKITIPIFGAGGVGKTTLAQYLSGGIDPFTGPTEYRESLMVRPVKLTSEAKKGLAHVPGVVIDVPGQERRVEGTWPQLFQDVLGEGRLGIVNVVAYGYHSLDPQVPALQENPVYRGLSESRRREAYFADRRERELALCDLLVDEVIRGANRVKGPMWILTVVTKQDLWWPDGDAARAFYRDRYMPMIDRLRDRFEPGGFRHEMVEATLISTNLTELAGRVLAPVTKGYDQDRRVQSLDTLVRTLEELTLIEV